MYRVNIMREYTDKTGKKLHIYAKFILIFPVHCDTLTSQYKSLGVL